jgi:hypothetical protein
MGKQMKNKQDILSEIQVSLRAGIIAEADLQVFMHESSRIPAVAEVSKTSAKSADKLSAAETMYYIAGIVLYAAILSVIVQSWSSGNVLMHTLLSAGIGAILWSTAYYLIKSSRQNELRSGLINSILLTGSLLLVTGGYIITNELFGSFGEINFIPGAVMLAVLGAVHVAFDRLLKRELTLMMGIFLLTASVPALLFGFLKDANAPKDLWSIVLIISAGLLAYATRVVAKITPDRNRISNYFDSFSTFVIFATMYLSSFGELGVVWLVLLIAGVFGIFYLSIINQNKHLLGYASVFMIITVVTISLRYFSSFGITASLFVATLGLLGSAAAASSINKKYFKQQS